MAFVRRKREEPKVEMTSMLDVVFLLLIFFMISTTFVQTSGISIKLPKSTSGVVEKGPKEIRIYVDKTGQIFLRDKPLSLAQLEAKLHGFGVRAKNMTFLLLADRATLHGRVVQLMDAARESGFRKLAIATQKKSQ